MRAQGVLPPPPTLTLGGNAEAGVFRSLCPPGCSALSTGVGRGECVAGESPNIAKSSDSTVRRMCRAQASRVLS